MTSVPSLDLATNYANENPRASSAKLDGDHAALEVWANTYLLPALAKVIRDDDTLVDAVVRYRNLHQETIQAIQAGLGSVTTVTPADASVTAAKIVDGQVTTAKLADLGVTTAKIADLNVTTAKIALLAITTALLANDSVTIGKMAAILATGTTTARRIETRLSEQFNVKDFGAVGDGVTDDTTAIQAAVTAAVVVKGVVLFPAGTYLVTNQINLPIGSQLKGATRHQYTRGFGVDPLGTTISFQPTTPKSLFVATGTQFGGFRFHYSIEGFYLRGNSTFSGGNSVYALDLNTIIYGRFENIGIEQFTTPIRCTATINNRFCNVYASGKDQAVLYAGSNETTDVWEQCSFWSSPIGVTFAGSSIGVRFHGCLFEQLDTYGMQIAKECQNILVTDCYGEDSPFTNIATNAMFRVGYTGSALVTQNQIIITGGHWKGRNAGAVGSFIDCDFCNGVMIQGVSANGFTNLIKTSANTRATSIVVFGMAGVSYTTFATDTTKTVGIYPRGVINSGSNTHDALLGLLTIAARLETPEIRHPSAAAGAIFPDAAGNVVLGTAALATTATDGFLHIQTCAGTPTGVPTGYAGRKVLIYDTTANKLWAYNGSWRSVALV